MRRAVYGTSTTAQGDSNPFMGFAFMISKHHVEAGCPLVNYDSYYHLYRSAQVELFHVKHPHAKRGNRLRKRHRCTVAASYPLQNCRFGTPNPSPAPATRFMNIATWCFRSHVSPNQPQQRQNPDFASRRRRIIAQAGSPSGKRNALDVSRETSRGFGRASAAHKKRPRIGGASVADLVTLRSPRSIRPRLRQRPRRRPQGRRSGSRPALRLRLARHRLSSSFRGSRWPPRSRGPCRPSS